MDTVIRCYRYALLPAPVQRAAIEAAAAGARQYWNGLVAVQRWAEREIRAGRQASLVARLLASLRLRHARTILAVRWRRYRRHIAYVLDVAIS